ncbi:MAG: hypothetical protein KC649_03515, partial [Candidatus Omnitrophica bacterium]|nr:hypothetical protein [Candidatus Omnitrophota bacterium]
PYFDAHQIQQMRIEVGSQRTGNPMDAKVMIRNVQLWPQDQRLLKFDSIDSETQNQGVATL